MPFFSANGGGKKETEIIVKSFSMYNNGHSGKFNYKDYFDSYEEFAKKATWGINMANGSHCGMGWPNGNVKTSNLSVFHDNTYFYVSTSNDFLYDSKGNFVCFPKE